MFGYVLHLLEQTLWWVGFGFMCCYSRFSSLRFSVRSPIQSAVSQSFSCMHSFDFFWLFVVETVGQSNSPGKTPEVIFMRREWHRSLQRIPSEQTSMQGGVVILLIPVVKPCVTSLLNSANKTHPGETRPVSLEVLLLQLKPASRHLEH